MEWYLSGIISKVEQLKQKINALTQERMQKNDEYRAVKQKSDDLSKTRQKIEAYLQNRYNVSWQKKKKWNDFE